MIAAIEEALAAWPASPARNGIEKETAICGGLSAVRRRAQTPLEPDRRPDRESDEDVVEVARGGAAEPELALGAGVDGDHDQRQHDEREHGRLGAHARDEPPWQSQVGVRRDQQLRAAMLPRMNAELHARPSMTASAARATTTIGVTISSAPGNTAPACDPDQPAGR
jgi:hypothetical protein